MKSFKQHPIEIKSADNDYVVLESIESTEILARDSTYDGARGKAIILKLENPHIIRERYLKK